MSVKLTPGVHLVKGESETLVGRLSKEEGLEFNRIVEDTKRLRLEYRKKHDVCPKCGSDDVMRTLMGVGSSPVDDNRATCQDCQWVGIVHDLVPRKEFV